MSKSILYVFDNDSKIKNDFWSSKKADQIFICPVTTCQESINSVQHKLNESTGCPVRVISYLDQFHKNAFLTKDSFLAFISGNS